MAKRLAGRCGYPEGDGFKPTFHADKLEEPLKIKKPKRIFAASMGDIFHEDHDLLTISCIFSVMRTARHHTFYVLTKRSLKMREYFKQDRNAYADNIWLGVSVENQQTADERIPILLSIPAAKRFVSVEPMLGPVCLDFGCEYCHGSGEYYWHTEDCKSDYCALAGGPGDCRGQVVQCGCNKICWVVAGGETGPGARPCHPDWARGIRDQCQAAGVPFFFKGWGEWVPFGQIYYGHVNNRAIAKHGHEFEKVGKKTAGNLLDGKEWSEQP